MFKLTKAAAVELRRSMDAQDIEDTPLRIAAQRQQDETIAYQMGFDDPQPGDTMVASAGIDILIANEHKPLLQGAELDFVVMEDGQNHFIFLNPNDPQFVPPNRDEDAGSSDTDGGA